MVKSLLTTIALSASLATAIPNKIARAGAPGEPDSITTNLVELERSAHPGNVTAHSRIAAAAYTLTETYDSSNWFSKFNTQNIGDPTHGFVNYVSDAQAKSSGLYQIKGNQVYIGVDTSTRLSPNGVGRNSVRLSSNTAYTHGLFIADFAHIPGNDCGTWPAFWMFGPNWPNSGELDIIEGVNQQGANQMTLHSAPGCVPNVGAGGETGTRTGNADCGAGGGGTGCGVIAREATSYGTPFNANGGGVYASLWTSDGFKVWYFPTAGVPADIRSGSPNPANWGTPSANFGGGCNFDAYFKNMNMIFDITFCGDWAGAVWAQSACAAIDSSCANYVATQPQSFANTYWLVNSIKVYSV